MCEPGLPGGRGAGSTRACGNGKVRGGGGKESSPSLLSQEAKKLHHLVPSKTLRPWHGCAGEGLPWCQQGTVGLRRACSAVPCCPPVPVTGAGSLWPLGHTRPQSLTCSPVSTQASFPSCGVWGGVRVWATGCPRPRGTDPQEWQAPPPGAGRAEVGRLPTTNTERQRIFCCISSTWGQLDPQAARSQS